MESAHAHGNCRLLKQTIGLGHGYYDSDPDYAFIHNSKNVAHLGTVYEWKHNEARTLQMELEVYEKLTALGNPGKAIPFAEFSAVLAAVFSGSKDVSNNSSSQLDRLLAASSKAPTRCAQLQFLGEYLHAFEDTYAHRDSTNVPYGVNNGFGHGLSAGSDPNYTYNDGVYSGNDEIVLARMWAVREDRTLAMEKAVFEKLQAYGDPSKARSWAEVETVVREYNRIRENEQNAPGFTNKLALLTRQLSLWEYKATDSDGNTRAINLTADGRDQYSEEDGHDNRERNLCDLNGNRLKPEDYAGTILPTSNCPSR